MTEIEYVLKPEGFFRRTVATDPISNADALIRQFAEVTDQKIARLGQGRRGGIIHARFGRNSMEIAERLPALPLRTFFKIVTEEGENPRLSPVFKTGNGHFQVDAKWALPRGMGLFFVTTTGSRTLHYLVALDVAEWTGQYVLPLPNTFDDARLCMGRSFDTDTLPSLLSRNAPLLEIHAAAVDTFHDSMWNADLIAGREDAIRALVRLSGDGATLPPTEDWRRLCPRAGSTMYDWLSELPHDHHSTPSLT